MMPAKQKEILQKISSKFKPHLVKLELVVLMLFALSILLKENDMSQILETFLMVGSLLLSALYFLLAHTYFGKNNIERAATFMLYYSLSISVVAILFVIVNLPGGYLMLMVGLFSLAIFALVGMFLREKLKLQQLLNKAMISRILVVVFISALLYFAPADTLRAIHIVPYEDTYSNEQENDSIVGEEPVEIDEDTLSLE